MVNLRSGKSTNLLKAKKRVYKIKKKTVFVPPLPLTDNTSSVTNSSTPQNETLLAEIDRLEKLVKRRELETKLFLRFPYIKFQYFVRYLNVTRYPISYSLVSYKRLTLSGLADHQYSKNTRKSKKKSEQIPLPNSQSIAETLSHQSSAKKSKSSGSKPFTSFKRSILQKVQVFTPDLSKIQSFLDKGFGPKLSDLVKEYARILVKIRCFLSAYYDHSTSLQEVEQIRPLARKFFQSLLDDVLSQPTYIIIPVGGIPLSGTLRTPATNSSSNAISASIETVYSGSTDLLIVKDYDEQSGERPSLCQTVYRIENKVPWGEASISGGWKVRNQFLCKTKAMLQMKSSEEKAQGKAESGYFVGCFFDFFCFSFGIDVLASPFIITRRFTNPEEILYYFLFSFILASSSLPLTEIIVQLVTHGGLYTASEQIKRAFNEEDLESYEDNVDYDDADENEVDYLLELNDKEVLDTHWQRKFQYIQQQKTRRRAEKRMIDDDEEEEKEEDEEEDDRGDHPGPRDRRDSDSDRLLPKRLQLQPVNLVVSEEKNLNHAEKEGVEDYDEDEEDSSDDESSLGNCSFRFSDDDPVDRRREEDIDFFRFLSAGLYGFPFLDRDALQAIEQRQSQRQAQVN